MPGAPELSVIIAARNAERTVCGCLRSLADQRTERPFEVLLVDSSSDGTAALVRGRFPEVRLFSFPDRRYCGDARNLGVAEARAVIVAQIDADCVAAPDWVERVLAAHVDGSGVVGGAVANAPGLGPVGWASYLCEFSKWMPGRPGGWMPDAAGANMSYRKSLFAEHGRFIEGTYCSDTEFHWRLARAGVRLRFEPSIVVSHRSLDRLGRFLAHEFEHGRSFARVRVGARGFSATRRALYAGLSPLIPVKLFAGVLRDVLGAPGCLRHFLACAPLLAAGLASWSLGELFGYLGGTRRA